MTTLIAIGLMIQVWAFRQVTHERPAWYAVLMFPVSGGIIGWAIALPFQWLPVTYWVVLGLFLGIVAPMLVGALLYQPPDF